MDTVVGINAWVLHRNKDIFGDDVNEFRPERWIDPDPERIKEMRKYLFTVSCLSFIQYALLAFMRIKA